MCCSRLHIHPFSGNRGITADCFILEEAAFIPKGILTQIIAPMLKVSNSVLIALSTHNGEENYYSRLFNDPDPAMNRLYIRVRIELVCDSCKLKGKSPAKCTHKAHLNPSWLLSTNEERVKKLMGDDEETYAREVLGAFWANGNNIFKKDWLTRLEERPARSLTHTQDCFLFTMIDPAGGGSSKTGFCTILREPDGMIVLVGMAEVAMLEGPTQVATCKKYFKHFVDDTDLSRVPHFIAVERNYGGSLVAASFIEIIQEILPHSKQHRSDETKHGTWTCPEVNKTGVVTSMFELHDHRVFFANFMATDCDLDQTPGPAVKTNIETYTKYTDKLKTNFISQMGQFKKIYKASGSYTFSGKDGKGSRDDIAMCFIMAVYHSIECAVMIMKRQLIIRGHHIETGTLVENKDKPIKLTFGGTRSTREHAGF
jgi:hypothetical protein